MPVGQPDWSPSGQSPIVTSTFDVGELAARLGSAINFDRTGRLLFEDTFTRIDGFWSTAGSINATAPAVNTTYAETDGTCLTSTITTNITNLLNLVRPLRMWQNQKLSIEAAFAFDVKPNNIYVLMGYIYDEVEHYAQVRFYNNLDSCSIEDADAGSVVLFTGHTYEFDTNRFYTVKLDLDFDTKLYRLLRLDDKEYDLSAYTMPNLALALPNQINIALRVYGNAAANVNFYLDRVIFTIDD